MGLLIMIITIATRPVYNLLMELQLSLFTLFFLIHSLSNGAQQYLFDMHVCFILHAANSNMNSSRFVCSLLCRLRLYIAIHLVDFIIVCKINIPKTKVCLISDFYALYRCVNIGKKTNALCVQ